MSRSDVQLKRALELSSRPEDSFVELSRTLAILHARDPNLVGEFINRSGMGRRKAYYLLQLGQRLKGLRLPEKRLGAIGWTKLQVISAHLTPQNAQELLSEAEQCTTQELKTLMGGGSKAKRRCVLLCFSPPAISTARGSHPHQWGETQGTRPRGEGSCHYADGTSDQWQIGEPPS